MITVHLFVCPICGHVVDGAASTSTSRGCFGYGGNAHSRSHRVRVVTDVELPDRLATAQHSVRV